MKHQDTIPSKVQIKLKSEPQHKKSIVLKFPVVEKLDTKHFSCSYCDEYFTKKHLLVRHLKLHKTSTDQRKEDNAEMSEEEEGRSENDNEKTNNGLMSTQNQILVEEKHLYVCEHCGADCESKLLLMKHLRAHKKDKNHFICKLCGKEFKYKCLLIQHMERHGLKIKRKKPLQCRVCGKSYSKSGSLAKHELLHEGKGSFRCRPCGEIFSTEAERTRHKEEKHEKSWKCSLCHHTFATESKLEHHRRWHEDKGSEVFFCNLCGKEFKLKVNLKVHVESRCGTEPRHACKVCGKAFMTRGTLVTHSLLHTGEKTFLCRFCGKNFRLKVEMQRHERSHTGEKPFVCKVCDKAFAHRESLVTHNTIHTGIRPYMCEACGCTFSCIGNLLKHRKTHNSKCGMNSNVVSGGKSNTSNIPAPKIDTCTTSSTTVDAPEFNKSTEPPAAPPNVINRPTNITNEMTPFIQGNFYGYRNFTYENNHEWLPQLFTPSDPVLDRLSLTVELDAGNLERDLKSSSYYWNTNSGMSTGCDVAQQSFASYGNFVRDSLKPETSFQDIQLCEPTRDLSSATERQMGNFQNLNFHHVEGERLQHSDKLMVNISQNLDSALASSHYEPSNSIICDNPIPHSVILPENQTSNLELPEASNVLGSAITEDSSTKNIIDSTRSEHVHLPLHESNSQVKLEFSDAAFPTNNILLTNLHMSEFISKVEQSVSEIKSETSPNCDDITVRTNVTGLGNEQSNEGVCDDFDICDGDDVDSGTETGSDDKVVFSRSEDFLLCNSMVDKAARIAEGPTIQYSVERESGTVSMECVSIPNIGGNQDINVQRNNNDNCDEGKKYCCEYCNKKFDFVSRLNRHMKCHSVDSKEAGACQYCGRKYTNRACLLKHESQHSNNGIYKCKECNEKFDTKTEYRSHRAKQHGKQWKCNVCKRSFSTSSNLKNHTNNKHLGRETVASYVCHICGKLFKQKGNLKLHLDSKCGTDPQHVCNVCGKAFMSYGSLGTHSLLHTGEKTFLCRFCGKSYRLKVEMQRHERSHTGEKPFVCKVCNKAFAHRESLVTHNTLHTGIRPYMCEICGATFSCIGNLIKHRQTHNKRSDLSKSELNVLPD